MLEPDYLARLAQFVNAVCELADADLAPLRELGRRAVALDNEGNGGLSPEQLLAAAVLNGDRDAARALADAIVLAAVGSAGGTIPVAVGVAWEVTNFDRPQHTRRAVYTTRQKADEACLGGGRRPTNFSVVPVALDPPQSPWDEPGLPPGPPDPPRSATNNQAG